MNRRSGIETRKKILMASLDVFTSLGFRGASMRKIAEAADTSVGGIYLYFRNKEDLYLSLMRDRIQDKLKRSREAVLSRGSSTEALSAFFRFYFDYATEYKELIFLHIRDHGFIFGATIKKTYFRKQTKLLENIIIEGIRSGEFRRVNASKAARIIMATVRGIVLSMTLEGDRTVTPKELKEILIYGIVKH